MPNDILSQLSDNMLKPTNGLLDMSNVPQTYNSSMFGPSPNPLTNSGGSSASGTQSSGGGIWDTVKNVGSSVLDFLNRESAGARNVLAPMFGNDMSWSDKLSALTNPVTYGATKYIQTGTNPWTQYKAGYQNPDTAPSGEQLFKNTYGPFGEQLIKNISPLGQFLPNEYASKIGGAFVEGATDPLSYLPVGEIAKATGIPWLAKAGWDAVKETPVIDNKVVNGAKDALGNLFVKNYGASPELVNALQAKDGAHGADLETIKSNIADMFQQHGLNPDEMNQVVHRFEGVPTTNAKAEQAYQDLQNILHNGIATHDGSTIGTNAELNTKLGEKPILKGTMENYYPHRYDVSQEAIDKALSQSGKPGFSTSGPFNQERRFATVAEAMQNGFKPEMNPYVAIAQRLAESSKAIRNAQMLNKLSDSGVISKTYKPGLVESDITPLKSYMVKTITKEAPSANSEVASGIENGSSSFKNPISDIQAPNSQGELLKSLFGHSPSKSEIQQFENELWGLKNGENAAQKASTTPLPVQQSKSLADGFNLPKELSKAAPRYHSNQLQFANDLDRGAYIVGNSKNRSVRDADYLSALMNHTGLSEGELRSLGGQVRDSIKQIAKGSEQGSTIKLPSIIDQLFNRSASKTAEPTTMNLLLSQATSHTPESLAPVGESTTAHMTDQTLGHQDNFDSLIHSLEGTTGKTTIDSTRANLNYLRPQDQQALKNSLGSNFNGNLYDKVMGAWKKASTFNSLVHGHNIGYNGMWLGGAKPSYVYDTFKNLKNGASDEWYQRALRAGAVSADRGGFMDNMRATLKNVSNPIRDKISYAFHGALWDADKAMRTAIFRETVESGASDTEAAAKANKFLIDYNNLTPIEEKVMARIFPFYRWMKGNLPLQVEQWMNNTPKQVIYEHAKNMINQSLTGQNMGEDGKIDTGIVLKDGSHVKIDPYAPADEPLKLMREGALPFLYQRQNPLIKEVIAQLTNHAYYPGTPLAPNGKESMAKQELRSTSDLVPEQYKLGQSAAHAVNSLNPFGSGVMGTAADSSNLVNQAFGVPTKDKPGPQPIELMTKLLGGFASRSNPEKDAYFEKRNQQDDKQGFIKYLRDTSQPVTKGQVKDANKKIPYPTSYAQ